MKNNPVNKGIISENFNGIGPVSRKMVHERASELAQIGGRLPQSISQADYEQAKRELTGESDIDSQEAILDSLPESKRWIPCRDRPGMKRRARRVRTWMTRDEAKPSSLSNRGSRRPTTIRCSRPPRRPWETTDPDGESTAFPGGGLNHSININPSAKGYEK